MAPTNKLAQERALDEQERDAAMSVVPKIKEIEGVKQVRAFPSHQADGLVIAITLTNGETLSFHSKDILKDEQYAFSFYDSVGVYVIRNGRWWLQQSATNLIFNTKQSVDNIIR